MVNFQVYSLFAVLCCALVLGSGEYIPSPEIVTITVPHGSSTQQTKTSIPPVTAHSADPTTSEVNSTTDSKTTHVPSPAFSSPTPTPKPTTTSNPTTTPAPTTTIAPTTTSTTSTPIPPTPTPTPTPAPTPAPIPGPPEQGTWCVTNSTTNATCVLVEFAAQLNVTYYLKDGTTLGHVVKNVPKDAAYNGSCGVTEQWLQLSWSNNTENNTLTMVFRKNGTQEYLHYFNVSLAPELFPNASSPYRHELWHSEDEWKTPLSTSYRCSAVSVLHLNEANETSAVPVAEITFTKLQVEAFRERTDKTFSAARDCGSADVPDAVPIAVGCALGGLVAVVLIAYLVGRRRSAARGYLSM